MSLENAENVTRNREMSLENTENVTRNREMSLEKSFELSDEDLKISLNNVLVSEKVISKKHKRQ